MNKFRSFFKGEKLILYPSFPINIEGFKSNILNYCLNDYHIY